MSEIISVNKDNFQSQVVDSPLPVLVDFWASWCGPCKMFAPVLDAIAAAHQGKLKVVRVNVDEEPELSEQFDVMSIPTLALISKGQVQDTIMGALPRNNVEQWLSEQGINC